MSDVIKEWLLNQLGQVVEDEVWNAEVAGPLIAKLLQRYDLITKEQLKSIEHEDQNSESNFRYIKETINQLGIELSTEDWEEILSGKSTKTTILFYELYLALHDKNVMHYVAQRKIRKNLNEFPEKFKVEKVQSKCSELSKFDNALALDLIANADVIQWHKSKLRSIVEKCKASREAYLEYLRENEMADAENICKPKGEVVVEKKVDATLCSDDKTLNLTYDDLLEEERRAQELTGVQPDFKKAKGFMKSIKMKRKGVNARKENQERMQRMLLKELWDKILGEQKVYFEGEFGEKLLKQTIYEQQMVTKLFEIREESNRMRENKRKLMECIRDEHEKSFLSKLMQSQRSEDNEKYEYYVERERNLELHRRLYAQKLERRAMKHHQVCSETLQSIVDIATYKSDYQDYFCQSMPKKKWVGLLSVFLKGKPIYHDLEAIDLLKYKPDVFPEDLETIYIPEIERDNCIDDMKLEAYCNNLWSWKIDEDYPNIDDDLMKSGGNVFGYIIHRLLLTKYPKTPLPPPPKIPKPSVAVCANGLTDLKYIPALEKLLQARRIKVVQMQDAINYCLGVWQEESTRDYLDLALTDVKKVAKPENKPNGKGQKGDPKKKGDLGGAGDANKSFDEKNTQTPKLFPDEELVLTPAGNLGRLTYEILNLGETPNDNLMVAMFVEYLKSLQGIEGWVLINYPKTIEQVAILEEALNSVPFPPYTKNTDTLEDVVDLESRDIFQNAIAQDPYAEKRLSKLVPNPKPSTGPLYNTYLTAYIEIRSAEGDDIEEQFYDCFRSVENDNLMNRFYIDQGCKYTLTYKEMDFPAVKHLGKLILGDYSLPRKASVELFTDTVKYVEAEFENLIDTSAAEKIGVGKKPAEKPKASKGESADAKGKKDAPRVTIVHEDKETQAPDEDSEPAIVIGDYLTESVSEDPKPGEADWIYTNLPLPDDFQKILATIWENTEEIYMNDLKLLFFRERVLTDIFVPFRKFLLNRNRDFLKRPSNKNNMLHEFQVCYNEFDDDMRADEEVKAELHMRIHEFQEKLFAFCDGILRENEEERQRIIKDDWLTYMLLEGINIYSAIMQLEIDRCADTIQILIDYYTCVVTKAPSQERPLGKVKLDIIHVPANFDQVRGLEKYINYTETTLIGHDSVDCNTPYHDVLAKNKKTCLAKVLEYKKISQGIYDKLSSFFDPAKKPPFEPDAEVKDRATELLEEFKAAYLGETQRMEFRLHIVHNNGIEILYQMIFCALHTFLDMHSDNEVNYDNHVASVKKACGIFQRAVEEETKIQPEMVFVGDQFYIKLDSVLYESELPEAIPKELEPSEDDVFTIEQLKWLTEILSDLAPNGLIPERAFTFLLQDLLVCHKVEDGRKSCVPELWKQLHPHATHELMQKIFGDTEYIDWKDFIIYNLGIQFPTETELMETRESFKKLDTDLTELIYEHQFTEVKFWFDSYESEEQDETIRSKLIKDLLMRIFKIDQDRINYTALLLAFCKDENPVAGLAKAIELSLGKLICWQEELGEVYFNWLQEEILKIKTEQREGELLADDIVSELIESSIHRASSAYLEDYVDEAENEPKYDYAQTTAPIPFEDVFTYLRETNKYMMGGEESSTTAFTNLSQGREATWKTVEYFLGFDSLINVLTVCLPWHARNKNVGDCSLRQKVALIYQAKFDKEFNRVFTYQLFNEPEFVELISGVYKFFVRSPCDVVKDLVNKKNSYL